MGQSLDNEEKCLSQHVNEMSVIPQLLPLIYDISPLYTTMDNTWCTIHQSLKDYHTYIIKLVIIIDNTHIKTVCLSTF